MYIRDCKTKVCISINIIKKRNKTTINILNWPIKINTCTIVGIAQFPDFSVLR